MCKSNLDKHSVSNNVSHAKSSRRTNKDDKIFLTEVDTRRKRNDELSVDNTKVNGLLRITAVLVILLLLILLLWFCQYLCIKLYGWYQTILAPSNLTQHLKGRLKKYQKVKCKHPEEDEYSVTQALLENETCALKEPTFGEKTQIMRNEYAKGSISKAMPKEKQRLFNPMESRKELYTELPKGTMQSLKYVCTESGESKNSIHHKLFNMKHELCAHETNFPNQRNQRIRRPNSNEYFASPMPLPVESDVIQPQTKRSYTEGEPNRIKSFSDSDIKILKMSVATLPTLETIKNVTRQYVPESIKCKSKTDLRLKSPMNLEKTINNFCKTYMNPEKVTEMYEDLGMLFSMCMKQHLQVCQRKYCLLSRHLQHKKNHDKTKCRVRPKLYQRSYCQPRCNSGSVCCDTYDEYKLMFVSLPEKKPLYREIYKRRIKYLNQPCLSPFMPVSSEGVD